MKKETRIAIITAVITGIATFGGSLLQFNNDSVVAQKDFEIQSLKQEIVNEQKLAKLEAQYAELLHIKKENEIHRLYVQQIANKQEQIDNIIDDHSPINEILRVRDELLKVAYVNENYTYVEDPVYMNDFYAKKTHRSEFLHLVSKHGYQDRFKELIESLNESFTPNPFRMQGKYLIEKEEDRKNRSSII